MNEMKSVCSEDADADMLGDVVEHLMTPLRQSSRFGQFRTPAHVRHLMVQLIAPQPAEHILDPCCGTGSLLLDAYRFATRVETSRRSGGIACRGVDVSGEMCRIAVANSVLVASGKLEIANSDALGPPCNSLRKNYDVILSNPPFASQSGSTLGQSHSRNRLSAMAFVDLMMNRLGRHGRCATVVPAGLLTSMSPKCVSVRERLISEFELLAVIGLPVSTFTPYANVSTAIIVFRRPASLRSKRSATLMCQLNRDGFARGGVVRRGRRRTPTPSDIPTLLERWSKYRKSDYCDHSIFTDDLPETLPWRIVSATDLHRDNLSLLPSQWLAPLTPNDLHTSYADALEVVLQEYAGVGHELAALRRQLRRSRK
jgi:type I restriction enzyme M protein